MERAVWQPLQSELAVTNALPILGIHFTFVFVCLAH